jgi:hypothetical protein
MSAKPDEICADYSEKNSPHGCWWYSMRVFSRWMMIGLCLCFVQSALAHPIPEGVVFRGIQVVVWSQRIEVRYQLGLSDNMIRQELQSLLGADTPIPEDSGKALRVYRDAMFPRLREKLSVTIDHQPQELRFRRADVIRQHHIQIELVYRIDFQVPAEPVYFLLVDDNFRGTPGYHLAAIRSRGLVDIPEANAVPVLSRLSRDPETEEDLRILSTPVRRIEAMVTAIAPEPSTPPVGEALAAATNLPGSTSDQPSPPASETSSLPQAAPTPAESASDLSKASAEPSAPPAPHSSVGKVMRATPADPRPWIWPAVGGLFMLAALLWILVIARRS